MTWFKDWKVEIKHRGLICFAYAHPCIYVYIDFSLSYENLLNVKILDIDIRLKLSHTKIKIIMYL